MALSGGVDAIVLVELGDASDALEQEGDERRVGIFRYGRENVTKSIRVGLPEIRGASIPAITTRVPGYRARVRTTMVRRFSSSVAGS